MKGGGAHAFKHMFTMNYIRFSRRYKYALNSKRDNTDKVFHFYVSSEAWWQDSTKPTIAAMWGMYQWANSIPRRLRIKFFRTLIYTTQCRRSVHGYLSELWEVTSLCQRCAESMNIADLRIFSRRRFTMIAVFVLSHCLLGRVHCLESLFLVCSKLLLKKKLF